MVKLNRMTILKELEGYPVFTGKALQDITGKGKEYSNLLIYRLVHAGLIYKLEKNKYTLHKDPFIVASRIVWPSYISGWAALQYYHLTEQLPWRVDVITTRARKSREITFANGKIKFIRTTPEYLFGFKKEQYHGFEIFIAEKEKAIADAFIFKKASEEELLNILLKHKREINRMAVARYIKKMVRRQWAKKAKRFLEAMNKHD